MNTASAPSRLLTAEEFSRLPEPADGSKQELVRGEIISMAPPGFWHGQVQTELIFQLKLYLREHTIGTLTAESGVRTEFEPDSVRGPDIAFWSFDRVPANQNPVPYPKVAADLVIEIRSPDQRYQSLLNKTWEYLKCGVRAVWIVDPQEGTVTVYYQPGPGQIFSDQDVVSSEEILPGFQCRIATLFPPYQE